MRTLLLVGLLITGLSACDASTPISPDAPYTQAEVDALVHEWQAQRPGFGELKRQFLAYFNGDTTFVHPADAPGRLAFSQDMLGLMRVLIDDSRAHEGRLSPEGAAAYHQAIDDLLAIHAEWLEGTPSAKSSLALNTFRHTWHNPHRAALIPDDGTRLRYLQLWMEGTHIEDWPMFVHQLYQVEAAPREVRELARQGLVLLAAKEQFAQDEARVMQRLIAFAKPLVTPDRPQYAEEADGLREWEAQIPASYQPTSSFRLQGRDLVDAGVHLPIDVADIRSRLLAMR